MLLKALDLLRTLGWYIVHFIYNLIDSLFDILRGLNSFDIISSISDNKIFRNFHTGIFAIALTLLGLFAITRFVKKIIDPDEGTSSEGLFKEIIKCGILILMSTFLFAQASTFSIKLAGYTSNVFSSNNVTLSDSMLSMFIDYTDGYVASDEFKKEDIEANIKNDHFHQKKMYNDKYVTSSRWILPDEKDYKYEINWIMAIIVGGFFLYALFFAGMMLARRQIEFLFLFVISPIIFATSIDNKQRRGAVIEQLTSLILQGAVIMLIIALTALVMQQVNATTFFDNGFKNILIKSLLYIGCASFLLTGSQVVNRFIGGNVSANSGREQLMAMMGFGHTMGAIGTTAGLGVAGVGLVGAGAALKGVSHTSTVTNSAMSKVGHAISSFGSHLNGGPSGGSSNPIISGIGGNMQNIGRYMETVGNVKNMPYDKTTGLGKQPGGNRLARFGSSMMGAGGNALNRAVNNAIPSAMYRRYRR